MENQIRVSSEEELDKDARYLPLCPLSPAVLNICRDDDEGSLRECGRGNKGFGGELIKDVKYADDQGMVANTEAGLQSLLYCLNTAALTMSRP